MALTICRTIQNALRFPLANSSWMSPSSASDARDRTTRNSHRVQRAGSGGTSESRLEAVPHRSESVAAGPQCAKAGGLHFEMALGPATALGSRIAEPGHHIALVFEPIERPVQRANGQRTADPFFDFETDGNA